MAFTEREKAIKAMKRLYRSYKASTDPDHTMFRNSVYFYSIFLNFLKHDAEMDIEKRIQALEDLSNSSDSSPDTLNKLKQVYSDEK